MNAWDEDPEPGGERGARRRLWLWLAVGLALLVAGLVALDRYNPTLFRSDDGVRRLIYLVLLLALIGPAAMVGHLSRHLRHLMIWACVLAVLAGGYAFVREGRIDLAALNAQLTPERDSARAAGEARFVANRNGDFVVKALVEGTPVVFLVDTGASDVVLSPADAERIGLHTERLRYTEPYYTANGRIFGAPVRLDWVSVGTITLGDVSASVPESALAVSLLGMSFLGRLSGFTVRDGVLTLHE